jgi:hypothetical protein
MFPFASKIGVKIDSSIFTFSQFLLAQSDTAANNAGSLTINNKSLGDYEWVKVSGNQSLDEVSFLASDWFAGSGNQDGRSSWIIVDGDLTLTSASTPWIFTPPGRRLFTVLFVNGTLTVDSNTSISMTARGANHSAAGSNITAQEIRLANGTYSAVTNPSVPATGGAGAAGATSSTGGNAAGATGSAGTLGGGGGGGAGGRFIPSGSGRTAITGGGANGTSFGGGAGGGGVNLFGDVAGTYTATSGAANGGAGGDKAGSGAAGGGAGNPTGAGITPNGNGTGGILVVFAYSVAGSGNCQSNGVQGGGTLSTHIGGGGSGGGSVTVFAQSGTISVLANGGAGGAASSNLVSPGGAGGAGTARILQW